MACCEKKCTIIAEQEAWFARCEHCDRVVLKPIQEGFKYFKVSCSKPSEEQKAKIASYPYYRIKVDESFLTCTCCFREYNIESEKYDTDVDQLVYIGRLCDDVNSELAKKVAEAKAELAQLPPKSKLRSERRSLNVRKSFLLNEISYAESSMDEAMTRKVGSNESEEDMKRRLEEINEENEQLQKEIDMLLRLRTIRRKAPEITLNIMELANLKKELEELQPALEQEQKVKEDFLQLKEEHEELQAKQQLGAENCIELEKEKLIYSTSVKQHDLLEKQRNAKLEEAQKVFEEAETKIAEKNKELNKVLDYSVIKMLNFLEEVKDFREAQDRQKKSPLYKLVDISYKDVEIDSLLEDMKEKAEQLYSTDCKLRGSILSSITASLSNITMDETETVEDKQSSAASFDYDVPALSVTTGSVRIDSLQEEDNSSVTGSESNSESASSHGSFEDIQAQVAEYELD